MCVGWAQQVHASGRTEIVVGFVVGLWTLIAGIVLVAYQPASGAAVSPPTRVSGEHSREEHECKNGHANGRSDSSESAIPALL